MYSEKSKYEKNPSLIGEIGDYMPTAEFCKLAEIAGEYNPGEMVVKGWVMFRDNFASITATGLEKLNVYLVIINTKNNTPLFVRLPKALGIRLVEDFNTESEKGVSIEEYVKDIKRVRTYNTKYGTVGASFECFD